uniref:ATP synthase complex subunit 8 n=1 Tax=Termitogeton planus TaxID=127398 RepID=A0A0A7E940_9NEOP|nr:ATP synthase F0 subunit 8 [Termitogeton planus]URH16609.1 ATP synthase F0 subunit 8 [Termitogeton planus]
MPQMMPMEWVTLYMMFLSTFIVFNITNYFMSTPNKPHQTSTKINMNKMTWKW